MRKILLLLSLLTAAPAFAQTVPPLRIYDEGTLRPLRYKLNFIGSSVSCVDNSGAARTDCTITGGSSTLTLNDVYGNGAPAFGQEILLTSTNGGVALTDAATPISTSLFRATNNNGTVRYIDVNSDGANVLRSGVADGASAVGLNIDTVNDLANASAKLVSIRSATVEKFAFLKTGLQLSGTTTGTYTIGGTPTYSLSAALAVGTAQTAYMTLENTTAASAGAQQYSPMLVFGGRGWKTNSTAASQTVAAGFQLRPVQGAANPTDELVLWNNVNGAGYTEMLKWNFGTSGTTIVSATARDLVLDGGSGSLYLATGGSNRIALTSGGFLPSAGGAMLNGYVNQEWHQTWSYFYGQRPGSNIASATTIAPAAGLTHITGTTQITTITAPFAAGGSVTFIPDGAWTMATGGNIAKAVIAVPNQALTLYYDGTLWYPSY